MNESIAAIFQSMPDLLTTADLIKIGLFDNQNATYLARLRGISPDYIQVGRKIFYLKSTVIAFLEERMNNGTVPKKTKD